MNANIRDPIVASDPESAESVYSLADVNSGVFDTDTVTGPNGLRLYPLPALP